MVVRNEVLTSRVEDSWNALQADIRGWRDSLESREGGIILYHLEQFSDFCEQAHDCLWSEAVQKPEVWGADEDDKISYRSLVIGSLTSQWMQLRQVLAQRLEGSPYRKDLKTFDAKAHTYYYRLYEALPPKVQENHLSPSSPIIYLGRLAELTFFNPKAPGLLSVPFGAVSQYEDKVQDDRSLLALPHEVSHAIFERVPGLIPELQSKTLTYLSSQDPPPTRKDALVHQVIVNWLTEIVADMAGTALVGPAFGQSALDISIVPDDRIGVTDNEHPVGLIRPFIHLRTLEYLTNQNPELETDYKAGIAQLTKNIDFLSGRYLGRRFESLPALTIVTLEKVKNELEKVIEQVFKQDLIALANQSIGDVLSAAATKSDEQIAHKQPRQEPWGQIKDKTDFVLDISRVNQPEYGSPGNFHLNICEWLGIPYFC